MSLNNYYIKRIDELREENSRLKELVALLGGSCKNYNGKECMNGKNHMGCDYCDDYDPLDTIQ